MSAMDGRPRVLHVLEALEGGTARHLVDLVRHVEGYEHEVVIPPQRIGGVTDLDAAAELRRETQVHEVRFTRAPATLTNARAVLRVRRVIAERRPDVVHVHSSIGGATGRAALPARRRPSVVFTPNGVHPARAVRALERLLTVRTDAVIAVSTSEADDLRRGFGRHAELVVTIPNGVAAEAPPRPAGPDLRERLGIEPRAPLVGTVARLVPQKDPVTTVRAARTFLEQHADAHWVLIGEGPLHAEVVAAMTGLHRDRFHLVPSISGVAGHLGELDLFVLASRFEGAPYTPLEAMRAGVPVVLSEVVGNLDLIAAGGAMGVPAGDPEALARTVGALLGDEARRRALAHDGRTLVRERYDVRSQGVATGALYDRIRRPRR
jgi:glycosyltransferase involved in cell wall biosynthesis